MNEVICCTCNAENEYNNSAVVLLYFILPDVHEPHLMDQKEDQDKVY